MLLMRTVDGRDLGHLRGTETPCAEDYFKATLIKQANEQGREYALVRTVSASSLRRLLEEPARVGFGFGKQRERNVAVLGRSADSGFMIIAPFERLGSCG